MMPGLERFTLTTYLANRPDWNKEITKVASLVHLESLRRPWSGLSRISLCKEGTKAIKSCMMIEAVMYGITPRAKIVIFANAPPENISTSWKRFWPPPVANLNRLIATSALTPGTGMYAPMRHTAKRSKVYVILILNSGMPKMRRIASIMP